LARLAAARALVGKSVQYDVDVPDRVDGRTRVTVYRDGAPILIWDVNGKVVEGPAPFNGHGYLGSPVWPEGLDDDTLEAAAVLRRGLMNSGIREPFAAISRVRPPDMDPAEPIKGHRMVGACYTFQPENLDDAQVMPNWRNMSERREVLLKGFAGVRSLTELQRR
jgi:hypothetical protein